MSVETQRAYLMSLSLQLVAVWQDLGGKYAEWTEATIHQLLHERKITAELRSAFAEYLQHEMQAAIAVLQHGMLRHYKKQLNQAREDDDAARMQQDEVRRSCCIYSEAKTHTESRYPTRHTAQVFMYVETVNDVMYFKQRETIDDSLLTKRQARDLWQSRCWDSGADFPDPLLELVEVDGFNEKYYRIKPQVN